MERTLRFVVTVGQDAHNDSLAVDLLGEFASEVASAGDVTSALDLIERRAPELVFVWEHGSADETLGFVRSAQAVCPNTPVVVVSSDPRVERAVHYIRAGAFDYIPHGLDGAVLGRLLDGMRMERNEDGARRKRFFSDACPSGVEIVGHSPGIVRCLETVRLVSESRCNPVLILGETGSGKELVAKAVHWWRYGDLERLVAVNCAALTATLLESELFGHVKGAFTGADKDKAGLFERANGGSIFLDEISEMDVSLQAKLLRVLQDRAFRRVGGTRDIPCDATVLASSNKDLHAEAGAGRFRRDLYYRLAVFPIVVPPLRAESRRGDIPLLAEYFLESLRGSDADALSGFAADALRRLNDYDWPGNIRELRNVIQRASILEKGQTVSSRSVMFDTEMGRLEVAGLPAPRAEGAGRERKDFSLEAAEKEFILRALKETGWKRTRAAALLGITRATLHAKLKRYDIQAPGGKGTSARGDAREKSEAASCPA